MSNKNNFKVIQGGIKSRSDCTKEFLRAYVTDTRLMGAMGMCVVWRLPDCEDAEDLIQFFLLDPEELGLENYISLWDYNIEDIVKIEQSSIGCLGGKKIDLTEKEACHLVSTYYNMSIEKNKKPPKPLAEYKFVLERDQAFCEEEGFSEEEEKELIGKVCTHLFSDYQVVNYFLMRVFGNDPKGALYVATPLLDTEDFSQIEFSETSFFCKNTITPRDDCYMSESLINVKGEYYIYVSKLTVYNFKISSFKITGHMKISPKEAAMILNRTEYISLYEISDVADSLASGHDIPAGMISFELPFASNCTMHSNGQLIMAFKPNNHHVAKEVFRLNDDIVGTIFITGTGQLVLTSYTLRDISQLERYLVETCMPAIRLVEKYTFREAIMQDFIDSNFDNFQEFVKFFELD